MNGGIVENGIARNRLMDIQHRMIGLQDELASYLWRENFRADLVKDHPELFNDLPGTREELEKVIEASKIILDHVQKRLV